MKTRNCSDCAKADHTTYKLRCTVGHKPRFYLPREPYPHCGDDWGWKKKCADFEEGTPIGAKTQEIDLKQLFGKDPREAVAKAS
jgi:hypothetical protein